MKTLSQLIDEWEKNRGEGGPTLRDRLHRGDAGAALESAEIGKRAMADNRHLVGDFVPASKITKLINELEQGGSSKKVDEMLKRHTERSKLFGFDI